MISIVSSVHLVGDLVRVYIDLGDDFVDILLIDSLLFQRRDEVLGEPLKLAAADGEMAMHVGKGTPAVGHGTACGHGEKLALHQLELLHGHMGEVASDLGIVSDSMVEPVDEPFECLFASDAIVKAFGVILRFHKLAALKNDPVTGC